MQYVSPDNANVSAGSISQDSKRYSNSKTQASNHPLELIYTSLLLPWSSLLFFPIYQLQGDSTPEVSQPSRKTQHKEKTNSNIQVSTGAVYHIPDTRGSRCHLHSYPHPTWATCAVKPVTKSYNCFYKHNTGENLKLQGRLHTMWCQIFVS